MLFRLIILFYSMYCIINMITQNAYALPVDKCHCNSDVNPVNPDTVEHEYYIPRWFKKNCSLLSPEAAKINLFRKLAYLKQLTSDILSQTQIEYDISLRKSCLPSSTVNVTISDQFQIYERILKDLSRMATFVYRLMVNNEPDSSPNRSQQTVKKLLDDDKDYYNIDHILQQCQCYIRNILLDSNVIENAHNLAQVDWDQCKWGCKDDRCAFREIMVINRLKLIASNSLKIMMDVETFEL